MARGVLIQVGVGGLAMEVVRNEGSRVARLGDTFDPEMTQSVDGCAGDVWMDVLMEVGDIRIKRKKKRKTIMTMTIY